MRSGSWTGAKTTDNVRVWVNGTVRPVRSVRVQSGMRDGDPRSESGSWCVESTIEWEDPKLVTATSPHPFGEGAGDTWRGATEWLPRPGDEVVIETGDGELGQWWVQHRGVIDDSSGSIADGTARSTTVDRVEDLSYSASFGALQSRMPQRTDSGTYRRCGLQSTYLVDRLLRNPGQDFAGWNATPPATWQTCGLATLMGSLWPEVGTLDIAHRNGDDSLEVQWGMFDYGVCAWNVAATYLLDTSVARGSVVLTAALPPRGTSGAAADPWRMDVVNALGQGVFVRYEHDTDRIYYGVVGGSQQWILATSGGVRTSRVALHASASTLTLRLEDARTSTLNPGSTPWSAGAVSRAVIISPGRAGWWMVEGTKTAAQRWDTLHAPQTARIRPGDHKFINASRDLMHENAAQWLQDQVDAECAAMWLDEDGVTQWAGRGVLDGQSVARTITSVRDVDDIQWEQRRKRLARTVSLAYLQGRIDQGYLGEISRTLWQDDSVDCGPGELNESVINVPDLQDWIDVDLAPRHLSNYSQTWDYYVKKSCYGGTMYRRTDDADQAWAAFINCEMEKITNRAYVVRFTPWSTIPSTHRVRTRFPANPNALMRQGASTLALRGRARTIWVEGEARAGAGTSGILEYQHDVGWRVQAISGNLDDLLAHLVSAVTSSANTRPFVTGLTIAHDPRLQIGDKIRVRDTEVTGADFDMLIQERDIDTAAMTETIAGRCTLIRTEWVTGASAPSESRLEPAGPTPITPSADWAREEAV